MPRKKKLINNSDLPLFPKRMAAEHLEIPS